MAISSPGIGSGIDVRSIVDQLVAIERQPIKQLETAKAKLDTQLSSYGQLQSHMSKLQGLAKTLATASSWSRSAAVSADTASIAASAKSTAVAGTYSVQVNQLAASQSSSSSVFASPGDVGTGTITITVGTTSVPIDIVAGDNSLSAVRDKINQANAGVTATLIQDTSGPLLVLSGKETGAANAFSVQVSADATGELAKLDNANLTVGRSALDAAFTVNGIALTSAKNNLDGVIDGVDLVLKKLTTAPVDVVVSSDTEALKKDIKDFVETFNEASKFLVAQTRYEAATKTAGTLQGDMMATSLLGRLRAQYHQETPDSSFTRLSDIGVTLERDGTLKINDAKLATALANPAELAKAFSNPGTGLAHGFKSIADAMVNADGALKSRTEGLRDRIKRNEQAQDRLEDRVERNRLRLLRQYTALDTKVGQLNGLNNMVAQQMAMLQANATNKG